MPLPHFTADFVACLEIVGGLLVLSGWQTRLIAIPFLVEMIVAVLSTKISLYLGTSPLPLTAAPPKLGRWAVRHEIRSECAQLLRVAFLTIIFDDQWPGQWSLEAGFNRKQERRSQVVAVSRRKESANASVMV
jgi:putative oxidoreductase